MKKVNRALKVPLYMQVYQNLTQMIAQKKWLTGELLPSERELSAIFCVDRLTVRRALGMMVQGGQVEKIAGLGTRVTFAPPQPWETTPKDRNLIFLLPKIPKNVISADQLTEPFNSSLFFCIESECKNKGYTLIYTTISAAEALTEVLSGRGISGIFFASKIDAKFLEEADRLKIPAVVINNETDHFPAIRAAREKGTYDAIRYLANLNHREIGLINGTQSYITAQDCLHGFKRALRDLGGHWRDQIIHEGDWTFDGGFKTIEQLISEKTPLPTAIFAGNDMTALGAIAALKTAGHAVPEEISVIGCDGIEAGQYYHPRLTTVKINIPLMAKIACQNLFLAIESREWQPMEIILPAELIVRESTAPRRL
jgi:LacI family transcriptional regulator